MRHGRAGSTSRPAPDASREGGREPRGRAPRARSWLNARGPMLSVRPMIVMRRTRNRSPMAAFSWNARRLLELRVTQGELDNDRTRTRRRRRSRQHRAGATGSAGAGDAAGSIDCLGASASGSWRRRAGQGTARTQRRGPKSSWANHRAGSFSGTVRLWNRAAPARGTGCTTL